MCKTRRRTNIKWSGIKRVAVAAIIAVPTLLSTSVNAGSIEIKYRQAVMKAIGGHMVAMVAIINGSGNQGHLKTHADAMAALAEMSADVFPENSSEMDGVTRARGSIWDKPKEFAAIQNTFLNAAKKLAAFASHNDRAATGEQLRVLGKSACKACHTDFRTKK
jgi:cytochrome c556